MNREDRIVPVILRAEITISLLEPAVFEPLTTFRKKDSEIEEAQRRVLTYAFGPGPPPPKAYSGSTDMPFFLSCLHPAAPLPSDEANQAAQPADLLPQLLPFQRHTVNWLLSCEARRISEKGQIEDLDNHGSELPLFWEEVSPVDGKTWYLNHITGCLLKEPPPKDEFFGGILAEEPGLGKTLESIALVLLNPSIDRNPSVSRWDPVGVIDVKETTLIVTPAALAQQWVDELKLHAPSLKVLVYEGWTKVPVPITAREAQDKALQRLRMLREPRMREKLDDNDIPDEDDVVDLELTAEEKKELAEAANQMTWCDFVHQYDICITNLGVARAPLQRPRREVAKYADIYRDRSPLVMVEWNRVIMDEVQMVGGGKTEEMVSLIPRLSSFAVSGTPARAKVDDLVHVIKFLRINSVIGSPKTWLRLQKPAFAAYFRDLFGRIAVRTMKAKVQNELTIPQQSRFAVPIELGKVERHIYDENFEQALNDLGLDSRGVAASSSWQLDVMILRNWMRRLRGICTHPQVGKLARQNDRLSRAGAALKSIGEVLEDMKDQNWRKLMDEKKSKIQTLVRRSQLIQHSDNPRRSRIALEILLNAREGMDKLCTEISDVITEHNAKGEILKREAIEEQRSAEERDSGSTSKGKNPEREASMAPTDNSLEDDLPTTPTGVEHRHKKHSLQARLREAHVLLHQIYFRLGDVYHSLGESHSNEENHSYGAAEVLRKRLLNTTEQVANRSIAQVKLTAERKTITKEDMAVEHCGKGGINSEELLRKADKIIDILNQQAELLIDWRVRIFKLLTESLSASEGDSADGEEYARTLETQGEAETYLQAFVALLADRRELLVAERTALAAHESKERRVRHTAAAQRAKNVEGLNPEEMAPEHEVLEQELTEKRKAAKADHDGKALKSIFVQLQQVAGSYVNEKDPEKIIAKQWITNLKLIMKEQSFFHEKLDADLAPLRKAFNDRIQYFRQLQELSDSVRDVDWEGSIDDAIEKTHVDEDTTDKNINERRARQRYLRNLTENEGDEEDEKCCILCRCEFVRGFMTQCAHVYCEDCLKAWFSRGVGRACPICRVAIDPDQLQRITLEEKKVDSSSPKKRYVPDSSENAPHSRRVIEYNTIDSDVFEELRKIVCLGSYGTKIETLVRHLLYLEEVDPGCKSIVFSAWADSLYILERALTENGIACLRIDQKKGGQNAAKLFKTDHRIRVLLLHGERENAGLNVTCASRVFLTESVVQHSFELQAIARIDRLGQTRPTEVYCYYAENTVERNILDLAAKRGLSLYTKDHAIGTVKVTSFEMDKNRQIDSPVKNSKKQKGQKGDFIFKADDMLAILFPHLFEDVEYLLPEGTETDMLGGDFGDFDDGNDGEDANAISEQTQPVAGPSRLADLMNGRTSA
ncbi:uncharacterized protein FOMMEDRAFT_81201 [Fomitiporia mediterranea MF3/22]|uniref:uncharacterized protein n=1 Tax=Fomitiporia mediterranea (strain MF3/22) TaxID=694068 RepID=UPI0004407833|nr:uncharacterized protein FOMMEDRAFT_81201 [Fomitiporia mediterranea MF3/22]EJD05157.1 hypothetical protein FOMMEDRAFT_81201 [Fomitiporia mediterranea MF3/22]